MFEPKRILCLGDSNTYGFDPRSYIGSRYPSNVRWTGLLQEQSREIINCGQNGLMIPQERDFPEIIIMIQNRRPLDKIVVMLGSNDLLNGASANTAAARMEKMIQSLETIFRDIVLVSPPPMQKGEWVQSNEIIIESKLLGKLYRQIAEKYHLIFADAGDWNVELTFDGVHFSPAGHASFANGIEQLLE